MANNSLGSISLKLDVTKTLSNFQNDLDSIIKTLNQNPKEIAVKLKPITTDLDKYLKSAGNGKNSLANGISISSSDFHIDDLINKAKRLYDAQGTISTAIHNVIDAQRQMQAALASDTGVDEARENLQKLVGDLNTLYQTQSRYDRNTSFANDLKKGINDARLEVIKLEQTYSNLGNTRTAKQLNTDIASLKRLLNSIGDDNDLQTLIQSSEQVDKLMQKITSDVKLFKLDINNIDFNKMFGDKTLSSRVADVTSKLKSLSNGGVEVSQMIKTLRSEERAFNDAKRDETKLEHYRQLTVLLEQANMAYNDMSRAEKAANSDEALRKKIQTAREQLQILQDFSLNNMSGASEDTINRVAAAIQKLQEALDNVHTGSTGGRLKQEASEVEKAYNEVTSAVKYAKAEIADTSAAERQKNAQDALARSVHAAKDKWTEYQQQLEAIRGHDDLKQKLSAFIAELDKVDNMNDLKNLQDQFRGTEKEIVSITKNTRSFGEIIKEAFGNVGIYLSFQQVFMKVRQIISEMVGDVKELDSAMVELRKVTDETRSTYDKFFEGAKDTAVEIGTTMKDFINSTADFSRLGYNFIDAQELAKVATIYNNVGDDLSGIDEATSTIVSTMKAFGIEASDAITIVDKLNEVSNHFAVSSGDLGEGLARAASALRVSGNTIDEVIAMITGMTEITQNAEAAGLSLRTLSLRLRAADTDLKELGEDTDGVAESTAKLRESIKGLTAVNGHKGIDIMLDKETFKSTYQIMKEISEVWDDINDINRSALLEMIAGKQRANQVAALLENMSKAEEAYATSINSAGSAMREQNVWLDSIEAKTNQFRASFEALAATVVNSELVKGVVDFGTNVVVIINKIITALGGMKTIIAAISSLMVVFNAGNITNLFSSLASNFTSIATSGLSVGSVIKNLGGQLSTLVLGINPVTAAIAGVTLALGGLYVAYQAHQQQLKEQRQAAEEAANLYNEEGKTISNYKDRLIDLRTQLDNGNLTREQEIDVRKQILELQKEIIGRYGEEATGVNLLTASLEGVNSELDKYFDKISQDEWVKFGEQNYAGIQQAVNLRNGNNPNRYSTSYATSNYLNVDKIRADLGAAKVGEINRELNRRISQALQDIKVNRDTNGNIVDTSVEEVYKYFKAYYDAAKKVGEEYAQKYGGVFSDYVNLEPLSESMKKIQSQLDETQTVYDTYIKGLIRFDSQYSSVWNDFENTTKQVNDSIVNGDYKSLQDGLNSLFNLKDTVEGKEWSEDIKKYILDSIKEFEDLISAQKLDMDLDFNLTDKSKKNFRDGIEHFLKEFRDENGKIDLSQIEFIGLNQSVGNTSTDESIRKQTTAYVYLDHIAKQYGTTVEELAQRYAALTEKTEEVTETSENNYTTFQRLQSAAQNAIADIKIYTQALSEYSENGKITADTMEALNEANLDYTQFLEWNGRQLAVNNDAFKEYAENLRETTQAELEENKALSVKEWNEKASVIFEMQNRYADLSDTEREHLQTLVDENSVLASNIAQYQKLISELDYASSGYKAWLDAASATDTGEIYDAGVAAFNALKEGFESGKVGTSSFLGAELFLVPQEIIDQGIDKVEKYVKAIEPILTEGAEGVKQFLDMTVKEGLAEFGEDGVWTIKPNIDVDDFVERLGWTKDLVLAELGEIQEYGISVSFTDEDPVKAIETFERLIEAQQELVNTSKDNVSEYEAALEKVQKMREEMETLTEDQLIEAGIEWDKETETYIKDGVKIPPIDLDADKSNVDKQLEDLEKKKDDISNKPMEIQADLSQPKKALSEFDKQIRIKRLIQVGLNVDSSGLKSALAYFDRNFNLSLQTQPHYVKRDNTTKMAKAIGGTSDYSGIALGGELGREIVVDSRNGTWKTIGDKGAEFFRINKGDIVFDAKQTQELLSKGFTTSRGVSYLNGTAYAVGSGSLYTSTIYLPEKQKADAEKAASKSSSKSSTSSKSSNSTKSTKTTKNTSKNTTAEVDAEIVINGVKITGQAAQNVLDTLEKMSNELTEQIRIYQHQITMANFHGKANGETNEELIQIYKDMQEAVHSQAEKYREMGLDENSKYITELQSQWIEYADAIEQIYTKMYEDQLSVTENLIDQLQHQLSDAIKDSDYSAIREYTDNIVAYYRDMQDTVHEEADYYRSLGYEDTSDEINQLKDLWYNYRDAQIETVKEAFDALVANASDAVDQIQSVYDTMISAAKEYEDNGYITIDTFQKIIGLGTQYLAFLVDEDGQLTVNEEAIRKVTEARTNQLAVEEALNYISQLRTALEQNDTATLQSLVYATDAVTNSTWDLVYAELAELNLDEQMYQAALNRINALRSLSQTAISSISKTMDSSVSSISDQTNKYQRKQSEDYSKLLQIVMNMIKQQVEAQIDAIKKQVTSYKALVDQQKESLKLEREKNDYNKDVAKRVKEISNLESKIALLSLDDSREANAQRVKLEEDLLSKKDELNEKQSDRQYDLTVAALDKQAEEYEKSRQREIDILENSISSQEKIYQRAISKITNEWDSLYSELIDWNAEYGSNTSLEINEAWSKASEGIQKYGSYLEALKHSQEELTQEVQNTTQAIANQANVAGGASSGAKTIGQVYTGNSSSGSSSDSSSTVKDPKIASIVKKDMVTMLVKQMKENSSRWSIWGSPKEKLAAENEKLAERISQIIGRPVVKGQDGVWYIDHVGSSELLYQRYHSGGIVGGYGSLQDNEAMAVLQNGEAVLSNGQKKSLYRLVDTAKEFGGMIGKLTSLFGGNLNLVKNNIVGLSAGTMTNLNKGKNGDITVDASVNINGDITASNWERIHQQLKEHQKQVAEIVNRETVSVYNRRGVAVF